MACHNCYGKISVGGLHRGYYRDSQGIKWDATLFPVCKKCVAAGTWKQERFDTYTVDRLYLAPPPISEEDGGYGYR